MENLHLNLSFNAQESRNVGIESNDRNHCAIPLYTQSMKPKMLRTIRTLILVTRKGRKKASKMK